MWHIKMGNNSYNTLKEGRIAKSAEREKRKIDAFYATFLKK